MILRFLSKIILPALCLMISAGCVKIEMGQTVEEATESSELRAKRIRSQWANRLRNATPLETAQMVKTHVDSVCAAYIRYGFDVADEWQQGNEGRGVEIEASEMRKVVNGWVTTQKPILQAYEDNMEYGVQLVKESGYFDSQSLEVLDKMVGYFYDTYSVVFYPNKNVEYYEHELIEAEKVLQSLSRDFEFQLDRF